MDAPDFGVSPDLINKAVVPDQRRFFCYQCLDWLFFLDAYMTSETENFLANLFLEPVSKCQGNDHYGHADQCSHNRQADNEPGKGSLLVKSNTTGYERR